MPQLPVGQRYVDVACGVFYDIALRSDGQMQRWGGVAFGLDNLPVLPAGVAVAHMSSGYSCAVVTGSDGLLRLWGDNSGGQLNAPALPVGTAWQYAIAGDNHMVGLRTDGVALAWGDNTWGQCNIPALPPNTNYVQVAASDRNTLLLRSDGALVALGLGGPPSLGSPPSLPPGTRIRRIALGALNAAAILSDGSAMSWHIPDPVPALPPGVVYVDIACGHRFTVARRSDGQVVSWGINASNATHYVPPLAPGTSYLRISVNFHTSSGLVGAESTYVTFAEGCRGSLPPSRLIPHDTPQIGKTMPVLLDRLPIDAAVLVMGWSALPPVSLDGIGMPDCRANVAPDTTVLLAGNNGSALWELSIPEQVSLLGTRFYNQAIVLDPSAGNVLGAVMSAAAEGVVGG